jgi:trk system potassium uptake protein
MNYIVIGCGRVGAELAYRLFLNGDHVTVVDPDAANFGNLNPDFRGRTLEGDVLNREVLLRAGIQTTDGLAAVTASDAVNAVLAQVSRSIYSISNVVVRNYEPRWRPLQEAFGVQVVSPSSWGAQRIEELLTHGIRTVFSAGNAEVEVYEFNVPEEWSGHRLEELLAPDQCQPVAITRAGRAMLPTCESMLQAGDVVNVSATYEGIQIVRRKLGLRKES